jgi:hypothetical protein
LPKSVFRFAGAGAALAIGVLLVVVPFTRSRAARHGELAGSSSSPSEGAASEHAGTPAGGAAGDADRTGYVEGPAGRSVLADGLRIRLGAGERARLVVGAGWKPIEVNGPGLLEAWSAPTEVSGWRFAYEAAVTGEPGRTTTHLLVPVWASVEPAPTEESPGKAETPGAAPPQHRVHAAAVEHGAQVAAVEPADRGSAEGAPARTAILPPGAGAAAGEGAWSRAAQALDRNDFESADHALAELCADLDPKTRDAARLTRAKLWIARGRVQTVRPVLEDLAETGATALVRHDARELLDADPAHP